MSELEKLTEEQFITLTSSLQEAIKTIPWRDSVKGIGVSNGLGADKINTLETEALLIIYKVEPQDTFKDSLIRELVIDEKIIDVLVKEIEEEVFSPILTMAEALDSLHTPKQELEIEAPKPEILIPQSTAENKPVVVAQAEAPHKIINLLEENKPVEKPQVFEPKPEPVNKPTSIVGEHLKEAVATTSKYVGGIDPYREPLN